MRYEDPNLRDMLAGEYVVGLMPRLSRARFERQIREDGDLRRRVGDWSERLVPLDYALEPTEPPARVWRAIEAHLGPLQEALPTVRRGWLRSLVLWRSLTVGATALAAGLAVIVVAHQRNPAADIVAVLADSKGVPAWVVLHGSEPNEIDLAAIGGGQTSGLGTLDAVHTFELWRIRDGKPSPLGLLTASGEHFDLGSQAKGDVLAVSLEPVGGSPTGLPTGPVLYTGAVLARDS